MAEASTHGGGKRRHYYTLLLPHIVRKYPTERCVRAWRRQAPPLLYTVCPSYPCIVVAALASAMSNPTTSAALACVSSRAVALPKRLHNFWGMGRLWTPYGWCGSLIGPRARQAIAPTMDAVWLVWFSPCSIHDYPIQFRRLVRTPLRSLTWLLIFSSKARSSLPVPASSIRACSNCPKSVL